MNTNLTDITLVVDRSGSMDSMKGDAEGGINAFIKEQKEAAGDALFTLVQFDTEYEFLYSGTPIKDVRAYVLVPRGRTALLDALGRAVNETGSRLEKMAEADRPGLVVFVIVTDGQENSSKEFKLAQIKEMIERQQSVYKWKFIFLGTNQDAFAEAGGMGIQLTGAANYTPATAQAAYRSSSKSATRMRELAARGVEPEQIKAEFTEDERTEMAGQ